MVALLTAAVGAGCSSAHEVSDASTHANAWGCDQCHGYPPPPFFPADAAKTHPTDLTPQMCSVCHPGTVQPDGHSIVANGEHKNGQVEFIDYKTVACDSCHDTPPATGKHVFHVTTRQQACGKCHRGFDPVARTADDDVHMMAKDYLVVENGTHVAKAADAEGNWPNSECTECHAALGVSGD
jgi:hypothetical protein